MPGKLLPLFLFLFLVSLDVYPNTKLFPGYYINMKGDSVICNIEFNDWNNNPKTIQVSMNNEVRKFTAKDI